MIKLVIFDLDGVLVDTKDLHFEALNLALAECNPSWTISKEEHLKEYDALSTRQKLNKMVFKGKIPFGVVDKIYFLKQKKTAEAIRYIKPDALKQEIFFELQQQGIQVVIASNAVHKTVNNILLQLGLDHVQWYSNESVKRPKPAGEIYLRACLDAEVDPSETLVVEDSPIGRQAALNAGCHLLPVEDSKSWDISTIYHAIEKANGLKPISWFDDSLNVVIPMAGAGSRFEKAGYTFPKPLIEVRGKPMIQIVTENLGIRAKFIYLAQKEHVEKYNLRSLMNLISPGSKVVEINGLTSGAACTVLFSTGFIDTEKPVLIANSDQFLEWNPSDFYYSMANDRSITGGGLVTFKATHPKWSFAEVKGGFVTRVAEKNPISDIATAGIYYWKHGRDFCDAAIDMMNNDDRTNGEYYVAPTINYAIKKGLTFKPFEINKMWGLGTPEDLNTFLDLYKGYV